MGGKRTDELLEMIKEAEPQNMTAIFEENRDEFYSEDNPFSRYMHDRFKEHGYKYSDVIRTSGLVARYAYKLMSGEKKTRKRDYILRICFASNFTLEEIQKALRIYGMCILDPRKIRDAVMIAACTKKGYNLDSINASLSLNQLSSLALTE